MCGIAGFIESSGFDPNAAYRVGTAMGDSLMHRGPDSFGIWMDKSAGVTFVHRRLAVVDLSETGAQPMTSASGRYITVFNGEIYNHLDLRAELEARGWEQAWRGHSDTETLLACIDAFGFQETLTKLVGMFAIAMYDRNTQEVFLARDRVGEKPLYYGTQKNKFFFASELKAITAHPEFEPTINRNAICLFLRHNYIPAPYSIYEEVKLLPGCWSSLVKTRSLGVTGPLKI